MKTSEQWRREFELGKYDETLAFLYGSTAVLQQRRRYLALLARFEREFGPRGVALISAPGRSEIGGNHTDHQRGRVIAAAASLDMVAAVAKNDTGTVRIRSAGHRMITLRTEALSKRAGEQGRSIALVRGVLARMRKYGVQTGGFDAVIHSEVPRGAGLSSSAAFVILIGSAVNQLYAGGRFSPVELAKIGKYAENEYFGKPSGLLDQLACACGGFVALDFQDEEAPAVERIECDFSRLGLAVMIQNAGGSHAGLTDEYAAVTEEMRQVAACFSKEVLSEVSEQAFFSRLSALRRTVSDRALLRAIHFFEENGRVPEQAAALRAGDAERFCALVRASGRSSFMQLQNVCPANPKERSLALALALSERILQGQGAVRVHGGGFAGTVQAFVPETLAQTYRREMERVFGAHSCYRLNIRPAGGFALPED